VKNAGGEGHGDDGAGDQPPIVHRRQLHLRGGLVVVAFFVFMGAGQERAEEQARTVLTTLRVGDAYNKHALTLSPGDHVSKVVDYILTSYQPDFAVMQGSGFLGVVTRDEVAAFPRIVTVPPEQQARIEMLFDLAKQTSAGFEAYAGQIAESFRDEPALLEDVLDGLFLIAAADGAIHQDEHAYLRDVATIFGIDDTNFARIEARHVRRADDPYLVLGASREMSDDEIKRHYRRLVAENHPDREIARGLPEEAVAIATRRLAAINAAWDRIERERGLRARLTSTPA
jgi:DnaJ like chaperone protein